jgi:hypothetical protein
MGWGLFDEGLSLATRVPNVHLVTNTLVTSVRRYLIRKLLMFHPECIRGSAATESTYVQPSTRDRVVGITADAVGRLGGNHASTQTAQGFSDIFLVRDYPDSRFRD